MTPEEAKLAIRDVLQPRITKEKEAEAMDIIIDLVAERSHYRGRFDYSAGSFPEEGGNGPDGVYAEGDFFIGSDGAAGVLKDENEDPMEVAGRITGTALVTNPGQLGINWKLNQG